MRRLEKGGAGNGIAQVQEVLLGDGLGAVVGHRDGCWSFRMRCGGVGTSGLDVGGERGLVGLSPAMNLHTAHVGIGNSMLSIGIHTFKPPRKTYTHTSNKPPPGEGHALVTAGSLCLIASALF